MDILYLLILIVVIGLFFFINKYSTSYNPMFIVIILSIVGFVFLQQGNIDLVDYNTVIQVNSTTAANPVTDITNVGVGIFTVQSFFVLVFFMTLVLACVNIFIGDKNKE